MARLAESHQVLIRMGPATPQRQDVMDFGRLGQPSFFPALFTQWVRRKVPGAYLFPFVASVNLPRSLITAVPVVLLVRQSLMLFAVPFLRQPGTAGVPARVLRFSRHPFHLR